MNYDEQHEDIFYGALLESVDSAATNITEFIRVIMVHLIKWVYQPQSQSGSWATSINTSLAEIERLLAKNSRKNIINKLNSGSRKYNLQRIYEAAYREAANGKNTGGYIVGRAPTTCPEEFTYENLMNREFIREYMKPYNTKNIRISI